MAEEETQTHAEDQKHDNQSTEASESSTDSTTDERQVNARAPSPQLKTAHQSGTVVLVWQWLTYGLWSWTLASLSVLMSSTLAYFIVSDAKDSDSSWLVYVIATTLCLLPISFIIDRVYSQNEPEHKHGFAAVILVIHAVLAFLVSIGSLITAVVTLLSLATDINGTSSAKVVVIISAVLIAALGGLFFVRIVRPAKLGFISRKFSLIITVFAAITVIAALAGPYVNTVKTKSDRQIESGLAGVSRAIQDYATQNKKLPGSLDDLTFASYEDNQELLVKNHMVTYEQKGSSENSSYAGSVRYTFSLCVDYKKAKGTGKVPVDTYSTAYDTSYTSSYIDTSSHPAGHTCYDQSATVYNTAKSGSYN